MFERRAAKTWGMGKYRKLNVQLIPADRQQVEALLRGGVQPVRVCKRAQALRLLAEGQSPPRVGHSVGLTAKGVRDIGWRYQKEGLSRALYEKARPGAKPRVRVSERKRIVAMVCSDPPEGRARWTVRLIAEEAVKRKIVPRVGRETIRLLLLHDDLKPWREKNVVHRQLR